MNKCLIITMSVLCIFSSTLKPMGGGSFIKEKPNNMFWAGATFMATGGMMYLTEKVGNSEFAKGLANNSGYSTDDIGGVIGVTGALYSLGCLTNDQSLLNYAVRTPLAALIGGISTTQAFSSVVKKMPVIGQHFTCKNTLCNGICSQCRLRGIVRAIGAYSLTNYGLLTFENWLRNR